MQEEIRAQIDVAIASSSLQVVIDGNRAQIDIVSEQFEGLSRVKRQQLVYGCISQYIADGRLHAVTIKALAPGE